MENTEHAIERKTMNRNEYNDHCNQARDDFEELLESQWREQHIQDKLAEGVEGRIDIDSISNYECANQAISGSVVGKHRYEGGQVDWFVVVAKNECIAWYGSELSAEKKESELNVIEIWVVK